MDWPVSAKAVFEMVVAGIAGGASVAGVIWWVLERMIREKFVTKKEHREQADQVRSREERLVAVESVLKHAPTQADMRALTATLAQVSTRLEGVSVQISAMQTQVNMLIKNEMKGEK